MRHRPERAALTSRPQPLLAGGGVAVLRAGWSAGAGPVGFRCTGRTGQAGAEVPEPPADPGGSESARLGRLLPEAAKVRDQRPGEAQLGVSHDDVDQPGPPVRRLGSAELPAGPAQHLLDYPERLLQVESAEERLPAQIDALSRPRGRRPQSDWERIVPAGQEVGLQAFQRALDEGEFAGVVGPCGAGGQARMNAVSGHRAGGAVAVGDLHGRAPAGCGHGPRGPESWPRSRPAALPADLTRTSGDERTRCADGPRRIDSPLAALLGSAPQ